VSWLGLAAAVALLALGVLAVVRAPTLPLVFLAVGATELGHWFAGLAILLAVVAHSPGTSIVAWAAAALLLTPALRAWRAAPALRQKLRDAFGVGEPTFRWRDLFRWPIPHRARGERVVIEGLGGPLAFEFYPARGTARAPVVVLVHGGGWMAGDVRELTGWNAWLAERGYAVAVVEYRLIPTGMWPAQREDVLAVVAHLRAEAARFRIDADRVVFFGRSAGGQIVSAIAATGEHRWLRGCVCLYAPFDLEFAYVHGSDDDVLRSRWLLRCYLGGTPEQEPAHYREASAYLTARADAPPFLLLHGPMDELVWFPQSARFAARLAELGVPHALILLPWARHAFDYNLHGPGGQALAAALTAFLRRVAGPAT
jgi:acetyl esterase/lipase